MKRTKTSLFALSPSLLKRTFPLHSVACISPFPETLATMSNLFILIALTSLLPFSSLSFSPENPTSRRVLVLLDDFSIKSSHSIFFKSLETRGYELDYKLADDPKLALQRYGQFLYDGLILFAPTAEQFGGSLNLAGILEFVDSGHDLILSADTSVSDFILNIAAEFGAEFDEDPSAVVIDHSNHEVVETEGEHTLIASKNFILSDVVLGGRKIEAPVLFRGIGHLLNSTNSLIVKALSASPSAYSANPNIKLTSSPSLTGSAISLVSILQARNNARVMISGSLDMFSNLRFRSEVKAGNLNKFEKSGNEQFVTEISKWVFHERGHLKALNLKHQKVGETNEPAVYRIGDDLEFSVEIYEWSGTRWEPFVASDVQLQFFLMTPYVLKTLSSDGKGHYHASFKVPDVYGVFQFKVEYERLGYTSLSLSKQIPVRPFRHNEYERFITTAFPYYGASFSTMAAFFIFSMVYLYHK